MVIVVVILARIQRSVAILCSMQRLSPTTLCKDTPVAAY